MAYGQFGVVLQHLRRLVGSAATADQTDSDLLHQFIAQNDEASFRTLVDRHAALVLNVCRRVLGNDHDADDAFQATFLVLARKAGSIRKGESVGSWLYGVAYRIAAKAKTGAARRREHERQAAAMPQPETQDLACWADLRPILDEELSHLPEKYRQPIILRYLQGKSTEEAARELGWPAGSLTWRLSQALEMLRQRLARRGLTPTAALLAALLTEHAASATATAELADNAVRTALAFTAGKTAGGLNLASITLAEGALRTMWWTKLKTTVLMLLAVGLIGTGMGVLAFQAFGPGQPVLASHAAAPLPALPKGKPVNERKLSEPVVVAEAEFRVETDSLWIAPTQESRNIPLGLHITNQAKEPRKFVPWRGQVVLMSVDGKVIPATSKGIDGIGKSPDPVEVASGKTLDIAGSIKLGQGTDGLRVSVTESGSFSTYSNLQPGQYLVSLKYSASSNQPSAWTGEATTKPIAIEMQQTTAEAVNGLQLTLNAEPRETIISYSEFVGKPWPDVQPVKLTFTFTNVSAKPIKLNTYLIKWAALKLDAAGPDAQSVELKHELFDAEPSAATEDDFPVIQPGNSWAYAKTTFPGSIPHNGLWSYAVKKPGDFRLKLSYTTTTTDTNTKLQTPLAKGSWVGTLVSNEVLVKVKPGAGAAVNGLRMWISADKQETVLKADGTNAEPLKVKVAFTNTSAQPIKLDAYELFWRHMQMEVVGPHADSVRSEVRPVKWQKPAATAEDFPTLQPGQTTTQTWTIDLPGAAAMKDRQGPAGTYYQDYFFQKPGQYRVKLTYSGNPLGNEPLDEASERLAKDCWSGSVSSNALTLTVTPPPGPEANGLRVTLFADRSQTDLKADGTSAEPVLFTVRYTNVSAQPIKLNTYLMQSGMWHRTGSFLSVRGPDGQELARAPILPGGVPSQPQPEHFPELKPGAAWDFNFRFPTAAYLLNKPGDYRIATTYRGGTDTTPHPSPVFAAGSWAGTAVSNELVLNVKEPNAEGTNGLKLTLSTEKSEATMIPNGTEAASIRFNLTFTNVSDKPIRFNTDAIWRVRHNAEDADYFVRFAITGPEKDSVRTAVRYIRALTEQHPVERDIVEIKPSESWSRTLAPLEEGGPILYQLAKPGAYQIKAIYQAQAVKGLAFWTGTLTSNEVAVNVKPAAASKPGEALNGLKLTLGADKTETVMKADGKDAEPVNLKITLSNTSDQPIKLAIDPSRLGMMLWHFRLEITGPDGQSVRSSPVLFNARPAGPNTQTTLLQPRQDYVPNEMAFPPGGFAGTNLALLKPGVYRLKLIYASQKDQEKHLPGSWIGALTSNELVLTVKAAPGR